MDIVIERPVRSNAAKFANVSKNALVHAPHDEPTGYFAANGRPLGTWLGITTVSAPGPGRAWSIVMLPAPGGIEQSNQQL